MTDDLFDHAAQTETVTPLAVYNQLMKSTNRLTDFLVPRELPFAHTWGVPIISAFYSALDIQQARYVVKLADGTKAKRLMMTQGKNFSFAFGDVIYDNHTAYDKSWNEALANFRYRITVVHATSAGENYPGSVRYKIEENRDKKPGIMHDRGCGECSQHEFVRRLIVGMGSFFHVVKKIV